MHLGLCSEHETVLPIVPMFHINGWCIPYAALIAGANLVLPGSRLDGAALHEMMEAEKVTLSAGVPTVWLALVQLPRTTLIALLDSAPPGLRAVPPYRAR